MLNPTPEIVLYLFWHRFYLLFYKVTVKLNLENASYHSVQNHLFSSLLSQNRKLKIYRTVILLVVFCGYEALSFTLREEHRLRVLENRVLRKIFGPKGDEITGEWRRLHKEELYDLFSSPNIIWVIKSRIMRWARVVVRMGVRRDAYRVLVGRPD